MIIYIILIIITLLLIAYLFYKYKYRFWSRQPVFHYHNVWYWLFPPDYNTKEKTRLDKYYDIKIHLMKLTNYQLKKKHY